MFRELPGHFWRYLWTVRAHKPLTLNVSVVFIALLCPAAGLAMRASRRSSTGQLALLLLARLPEPLANAAPQAFMPAMIAFLHPDMPASSITTYVALSFSAYACSQFLTNLFWGTLSDRYGRKPVFLFGTAGLLICTLGLGFASNVWQIILWRVGMGTLSGNVVVVRTMIGEMVGTDSPAAQARGFSFNNLSWQVGYVLGPVIGGALVDPCRQHSHICNPHKANLLNTYPFAPPNIVFSAIALLALIFSYCFLQETLFAKSDASGENVSNASNGPLENEVSERTPLIPDHVVEPRDARASCPASESLREKTDAKLSHQVYQIIISYAISGLHTICFDQLLPVFLAACAMTHRPGLPFSFTGGLQMPPSQIGAFVGWSGLCAIPITMFLFPWLDAKVGTLKWMKFNLGLYPTIYFVLPYLAFFGGPTAAACVCLAAILLIKVWACAFTFTEAQILMSNATPDPRLLGYMNGLAQTCIAAGRSLGPILVGSVMAFGERHGVTGAGWWLLGLIAVGGCWHAQWIKQETVGRRRDEGGDLERCAW